MPDKLTKFLFKVAKSETALAKFLNDPEGEAEKAGVPDDQIAILMSGDAQTIFAELPQDPGSYVWVSFITIRSRKPPRRKRTPRKARKRSARRR